jgi:hypothetical protein
MSHEIQQWWTKMRKYIAALTIGTSVFVLGSGIVFAESASHGAVSDEVVAEQRAKLQEATAGKGFGPQAPRDLSVVDGANTIDFGSAPDFALMNLCNIHFHEGAEHRGGEFTTYIGNGDGHGYGTGFKYDGQLSVAELAPVDYAVGSTEHGTLEPGDTIEIHYVHSTADVKPGPTLASCLNEAVGNPQLRVEGFVYVLVNDDNAADLGVLNSVAQANGKWQAPNMPTDAGTAVSYDGSTTGPSYNEAASPFQVTWNVHPKVTKVSISSVAKWLAGNEFEEDHAHGVRNLVDNPALLSTID